MCPQPLSIDGSQGEGGGQILRTALALSVVTGKPFRIAKIRAGRAKPGLLRQHLTAVEAAACVSDAEVTGAALGSLELSFTPKTVRGGDRRFAVGTAGSTTLVLQTVLPALLGADRPSRLVLEGGTHNPAAPPFEFLSRVYLPLLSRMGAKVEAVLERPGFFPAGGGCFRVAIEPVAKLARLDLPDRGAVRRKLACARVAHLPRSVAERELKQLAALMTLGPSELEIEERKDSRGPGNVVTIEIESDHVTELFTAFGQRGVLAEAVAEGAARAARDYLAAGVPVGEFLQDQLLLPMALAGGGSFRSLAPTRHTRTQCEVLKLFLPIAFEIAKEESGAWRFEVVSS